MYRSGWGLRLFPFPFKPVYTLPAEGEWYPAWMGMYYCEECKTDSEKNLTQPKWPLSEIHRLEADSFLTILQQYEGKAINFVELGCGRAPWCLLAHAACSGKIIERHPAACRCLALEAEPEHYLWAKKHLSQQNVDHILINGAIAETSGEALFRTQKAGGLDAANWYGQSLHTQGNLKVNTYSLDALCQQYDIKEVACVHMDVQGAELAAIRGAAKIIERGGIDHLIIGTHPNWREGEYHNDTESILREMLGDRYELLCEIPNGGVETIVGYNPEQPMRIESCDDGIQVWRRKGF